MKKVNFVKRIGNLKALFTVAHFSWKSIVMRPFMSQKTANMSFFTDRCARNFFDRRVRFVVANPCLAYM